MSQPKRYSLVASYYCSDAKMEAFVDGEYVRHADYAALQAENQRLRKESIAGMHLRSDVISWLGDDHDFLDDYQKAMDAAKEVQS